MVVAPVEELRKTVVLIEIQISFLTPRVRNLRPSCEEACKADEKSIATRRPHRPKFLQRILQIVLDLAPLDPFLFSGNVLH